MNIKVKSATYTQVKDGNETQVAFNFFLDLTAKNKMRFVNTVIDTIIDADKKRYNGIIKDLIFDFTIIEVFTDVDTTDIHESTDVISTIEDFIAETNIVDIVTTNISTELMESLRIAIDENIQYKTGVNPNNTSSAVSNLFGRFEKMLDNVDVNELVDFANKVGGISDNLSVDKIIDAYSHSAAFQKIADGIAKRDEHIAKVVSIAKNKSQE